MIQATETQIRVPAYKIAVTVVGALFLVIPFLPWSVFKIDDLTPPSSIFGNVVAAWEGEDMSSDVFLFAAMYSVIRLAPFWLYPIGVVMMWADSRHYRKVLLASLITHTLMSVTGGIVIFIEAWFRYLIGAWLNLATIGAAWIIEWRHRRQG